MRKKKRVAAVEVAAAIYGCEVGELMGWHEFEDGAVAIIAPTGQKFVYPAGRILEEQDRQMNVALRDSKKASTQKAPEAAAGMASEAAEVENAPDPLQGDERSRALHAKAAPALPGKKTGKENSRAESGDEHGERKPGLAGGRGIRTHEPRIEAGPRGNPA